MFDEMRTEHDWTESFKGFGAFWKHDGNPERPYVRLTSGLISDGYFNCGLIVSEHPRFFRRACTELARKISPPHGAIDRIVGAAKGGIVLSYNLASSMLDTTYAYAEKPNEVFVFDKRFSSHFRDDERIMMVEDTISTAGTLRELRTVILREIPGAILYPQVLAICNRSGKTFFDDFSILSLITLEANSWQEGENPFTPDGNELVPPLPAGKANWHQLTREYA
ncbi:MAG: hypothetical protein AAB472_01580 [Patescibacteria group bacterium]